MAAGQPANPSSHYFASYTPSRLKFLAPVCPSSSLSALAAASRAVGPRIWHPTNGTTTRTLPGRLPLRFQPSGLLGFGRVFPTCSPSPAPCTARFMLFLLVSRERERERDRPSLHPRKIMDSPLEICGLTVLTLLTIFPLSQLHFHKCRETRVPRTEREFCDDTA